MERNFKDVVENIRGAEKDVDKVRNVSDPAARPHTVIEGGPHGKQILP